MNKIVFGFVLLFVPTFITGQCQVNLDDPSRLGQKYWYPPLLLQNSAFIFPINKDNRTISFAEKDELELYCHGSKKQQASMYVKMKDTNRKNWSVTVVCSQGKFIDQVTKEAVQVEPITCNKKQEPRLKKIQERCSPVGSDGRSTNLETLMRVSIGWQVGDIYIEQIGLCIDESNFGTIWTNHTVYGASIEARDKTSGRPGFRADTSKNKRFFKGYTSTKLNNLYSKKEQKKTVTNLLGGETEANGEVIIDTSPSGTDYFAKGHLAPDASFIYDVMQDATYYFVNVAPQFQSFNARSWKMLEENVRDLGDKLGRDLHVVTGTHEILQYWNTNYDAVNIFLGGTKSKIPAPKYYWKVVIDPKTNTGAAFIGLNDPHGNIPNKLCTDRCADISWMDWEVNEQDAGFMYCCTVEDAAKAIKAIPDDLKAPKGLLQDDAEIFIGGNSNTCQAGPCNCTCAKNDKAIYTCTCTCQE